MSNKQIVLNLYKRLNKIVKEVFNEDSRALNEAKVKIRTEFRKNSGLDLEKAKEKLKVGEDVANILKTQVVQLVKKAEATNFELKIRDSTAKLDNVIFKEDAILPEPRAKKCKDPKS